jgi:hypothetical protein
MDVQDLSYLRQAPDGDVGQQSSGANISALASDDMDSKHLDIDEKGAHEHIDYAEDGRVGPAGLAEAINAEHSDQNMGVWEAARKHKMAVFWSIMVSMTVVRLAVQCRILTSR